MFADADEAESHFCYVVLNTAGSIEYGVEIHVVTHDSHHLFKYRPDFVERKQIRFIYHRSYYFARVVVFHPHDAIIVNQEVYLFIIP